MEYREAPFVLTCPDDWQVVKHDSLEGDGNTELGGVDFRITGGPDGGEYWVEFKSRKDSNVKVILDEAKRIGQATQNHNLRQNAPQLGDLPWDFRQKLLGTAAFLVFSGNYPQKPIRFIAVLALPDRTPRDEKVTILDSLHTKLEGLFTKAPYGNLSLRVCTSDRIEKLLPGVQIALED